MIQPRIARLVAKRSGFTLIELLVVIAILVLLLSLSLGAVFKGLQVVRRGNTERTMQKTFQRFDARFKAIAMQAKTGELPTFFVTLPPAFSMTLDDLSCSQLVAGTTPTHSDPDLERRRARVLYLKYLVRISFPMNFAEIQYNARAFELPPNGTPIQPDPFAAALFLRFRNMYKPDPMGVWTYVDANGYVRAKNQDTEFGACMALVYAQLGSLDDMSPGELVQDDTLNQATGWSDGIPRICDAWGTPMRMYRWPTACQSVIARGNPVAYPCPPGNDPQDPEGLLDVAWLGNFANFFANNFHYAQAVPNQQNQTFTAYAPFTIVSAGPDRQFGFDLVPPLNFFVPDPMRVSATPAIAADEVDNLYSFRFRLGVAQQGQ